MGDEEANTWVERPTKKWAVNLFDGPSGPAMGKTCFKLSLHLKQAWLTQDKSKDESVLLHNDVLHFVYFSCMQWWMYLRGPVIQLIHCLPQGKRERCLERMQTGEEDVLVLLYFLLLVPAFGLQPFAVLCCTIKLGASISLGSVLTYGHAAAWSLEFRWSYVWNFPNYSVLLHRC